MSIRRTVRDRAEPEELLCAVALWGRLLGTSPDHCGKPRQELQGGQNGGIPFAPRQLHVLKCLSDGCSCPPSHLPTTSRRSPTRALPTAAWWRTAPATGSARPTRGGREEARSLKSRRGAMPPRRSTALRRSNPPRTAITPARWQSTRVETSMVL